MPKVRFLNEVVEVEAKPGETIKDCAERHGLPIFRGFWTFGHKYLFCPGSGVCGACKVWVNDTTGALPARTSKEQKQFGAHSTARYSCRTPIFGDIEVKTQPNGPAPVANMEWPRVEGPSRWKQRLVDKEAALAAGGAAGADEEEAADADA